MGLLTASKGRKHPTPPAGAGAFRAESQARNAHPNPARRQIALADNKLRPAGQATEGGHPTLAAMVERPDLADCPRPPPESIAIGFS